MKKYYNYYILFFFWNFLFLSIIWPVNAIANEQEQESQVITDTLDIASRIRKLSNEIDALNTSIDITVTNVSIQEFIRAVANLSGANVNIDPELNFTVVNNFSRVKVADLLIFLCKQYQLEFTAVGSIIDIYRPKTAPLKGVVYYNKDSNLLGFDFQSIPLSIVARQISQETGINLFAQPEIQNHTINIFIQNLPVKNAIENLVKANNLTLEVNDDGSYFIKRIPDVQLSTTQDKQGYTPYRDQQQNVQSRTSQRTGSQAGSAAQPDNYELRVNILDENRISIVAVDAPMYEVVKESSRQLGVSYFLGVDLKDVITLSLHNINYDDLLRGMFTGKDITFVKDGDAYIIGDRKMDSFKASKIIHFKNRPVDSLLVKIPKEMLQDLTIKEFPDLNSLLVSGSHEKIMTFQDFCKQIDKVVPVIMIEVIIVDVSSTTTLDTGLEAGLGEGKTKTSGSILSGIDLKLSTSAINDLISKINSSGMANLGKVSGDFYLNIKALESVGMLKIRSTPILSTLNGHEATINIGRTEYYLLEQSSVISGQTPIQSITRSYPSVEAKLEVAIKPFVSGNEQITLNVTVKQSDFTERIDKFAPPGQVSRDFSSKIRVKNQEMVLLGGLEEISTRETASGIPFIQRIPILKWFFSSRSKQNSDTKLNIFIRPTIIG